MHKGTLEMQISSELYKLNSGDFTIVFPNVPHSYHTLSDNQHTSLRISNCGLHLLPMHKMILLNNHPTSPIISSDALHPDMKWIEDRLFRVNPLEDNAIFVSALFSMILCHTYPTLKLVPNETEKAENLITEIVSYVSQHYLENINLDTLSKHFGISKYKLSRIFSNTIHSSFPDYLKKQRINAAEFLLTNTDEDITNIAYECGFNNQQSFNRAFQELNQTTPREFRHAKRNFSCPDDRIPPLPKEISSSPPETTSIMING